MNFSIRKLFCFYILIFAFLISGCNQKEKKEKYIPGNDIQFPVLEIEGSYYDIGYAIGKHFGENIKVMLHRRKAWFEDLKDHFLNDTTGYYEQLLLKTKEEFPQYIKELQGMSDASGVEFTDLFILNIKAEISAYMKNISEDVPGCSTVYFREDENWFFFFF